MAAPGTSLRLTEDKRPTPGPVRPGTTRHCNATSTASVPRLAGPHFGTILARPSQCPSNLRLGDGAQPSYPVKFDVAISLLGFVVAPFAKRMPCPGVFDCCSADSPAPSITTRSSISRRSSRVGTNAVGISGAIRTFFCERQGSPVCTYFSRPHAS